jgi:hypothetical protein
VASITGTVRFKSSFLAIKKTTIADRNAGNSAHATNSISNKPAIRQPISIVSSPIINPGTKVRGTTTIHTTVEIAKKNMLNKPAPRGKTSRDVVNKAKQAMTRPKPVNPPTMRECVLAGARSLLSLIVRLLIAYSLNIIFYNIY